jgi:putative nucleotidyltransferase with HDIG domain
MLKIIPIQELTTGMFVNAVTKQSGKFKVKTKGLVRTEKVIEQLKQRGILEVEIDTEKSTVKTAEQDTSNADVANSKFQSATTPVEKEIPKASELYDNAKLIQQKLLDDVKQGKPLDLTPVSELSDQMIHSVFRNQDALLCMSRIREKDSYLLEHSLNVSILMTIFAKHLGFDDDLIEQLSMGGLLHDIGKVLTPDEVLHKPGRLSEEEYAIMKEHVVLGTQILESTPGLSSVTKEVAANHHERIDGSGYPNQLKGEELTIYSRMIAIVDAYDAITAERVYKVGASPNKAFAIMMKNPGEFDPQLLQQFIKAIGIHPVGTLVKLQNSKLAIVTKANKEFPLKPVVTVFYHAKQAHHLPIERVNLAKKSADSGYDIESSVKPEEFKINLSRFFKDVFVSSLQNS